MLSFFVMLRLMQEESSRILQIFSSFAPKNNITTMKSTYFLNLAFGFLVVNILSCCLLSSRS
jgi:hypothetical protein